MVAIRKRLKYSLTAGLTVSALILVVGQCRPLADFYSERIYPVISAALSLIASPFRFSLQGCLIPAIIIWLIAVAVVSRRRYHSWKLCIARCASIVVWVFVWAYLGWGLNYSRSSIYDRAGIERTQVDSAAFSIFLEGYTKSLNDARVEVSDLDKGYVEAEVKRFYSGLDAAYGLCTPKDYQHPKPMLPGWYQSWTGILGYIGPFFCESHLNRDLLPIEYPFTLSHEFSHLMGVSSEAEANWWAWRACLASESGEMRYSAYFSMLPHCIVNARKLLSKSDYEAWLLSISKDVLEDYSSEIEYWNGKRLPVLEHFQSWLYDMVLRSNGVESGIQNYSEVMQIIMSFAENRPKRRRQDYKVIF